jgi:hypothetical protein
MRTLLIYLLITLMTGAMVSSQVVDSTKKARFGIEVSQFITGSGFSSGTEMLVSVTEGKRVLSLGFYFCSEAKRITGIIAHHEVALIRYPAQHKVVPYAFYNGIARITRVEPGSSESDNPNDFGTYKSFEHHLGIGFRAGITRSIYLSGALGYGVYFGSVKKPVYLTGTNEMMGGNGFSPLAKLGIGFRL